MRGDRQTVLVLDLTCVAWCQERRREIRQRLARNAGRRPETHPFTFSDVPPDLVGGDVEVVLEPSAGVKS